MSDQKSKDQISKVSDETKQELALLLISLTGWEETSKQEKGKIEIRASKSFNNEIIDKMQEDKLIHLPGRKKSRSMSVLLLDEGQQQAIKFLADLMDKDIEIEASLETIQALYLILIYLTGYEEDSRKEPGKKEYRGWKGYDYFVINALQEKNHIFQIPGTKSLLLTESGKKKCIDIQKKYLVKSPGVPWAAWATGRVFSSINQTP